MPFDSQSGEPDSVPLRRLYGWVLSFLEPYRLQVCVTVLLGILISGVNVFVPKFVQVIVDDVLPARDTARFYALLWWMAAAAAATVAATLVKRWNDQNYQTRISGDMQAAAFKQLRLQGYVFFERHPVGDLLSLFHHELDSLQQIHRKYVPNILQNAITFIVAFGFMVAVSWQLSLVFLPGILLYIKIGPYFERKSAEYAANLTVRHTELNKRQYDSISSLAEVRAYGREQWDMDRLLSEDRETAAVNVVFFKLINYRGGFRRVAVYLSGVLMFLTAYPLISHGLLSVGQFTAFMMLYYRVMFDMTLLSTNLSEQRVLLLQTTRLFRFMGLQPEVAEAVHPTELRSSGGALELREVTFGYRKDEPVLQALSLTILAGRKTAFVGTSGHGKSTLIKLLGRLYDPTSGEILLDGVSLRELSFATLRENVSYVFQESYLFGASVRDNIRFGRPDATDDEVISAAKAASADEFVRELPEGYDTLLGERGNKLSGGQKQRIAIARMILRDPQVLVLDEATSALDSLTELAIKQSIDTHFSGRTIIAVAHRFSTIRDYDVIHVVEHGRIAETGTYDELMARKGAFYRMAEKEEVRDDCFDMAVDA